MGAIDGTIRKSDDSFPYALNNAYCAISDHSAAICYRIRYDAIEEFNVDSKAECDLLNLAHETKTNKRQRPLSSVQVQDH